MSGCAELHLPVVQAILDDDLNSAAGLTEFVRCTLHAVDGAYRVRVIGTQSSGVLRSMSLGQGLLIAPPEVSTLHRGAQVRVIKLSATRHRMLPTLLPWCLFL